MHRIGELARLFDVRFGRLDPEQVGVRRVREAARDRRVESPAHRVESLGRAFAGQKLGVARVDVARDDVRSVGVGARDDDRRNVEHVGRETGGHEMADRFLRRNEHLAAEMAALLFRRELIFEVDAGGAGLDHGLHQFEAVEVAAESGFRVGDDRQVPLRAAAAFERFDLIQAR